MRNTRKTDFFPFRLPRIPRVPRFISFPKIRCSFQTTSTIGVQKGRARAGCEWFRALSAGTPPHGQTGSLPPQRLEMKHNYFHLRKNSRVTAAARAKEQRTGSGTGPGPPESPVQELWVAAAKLVGIR